MSDSQINMLFWGISIILSIICGVFSGSAISEKKRWIFGVLTVLCIIPFPIVKCDTYLIPAWLLLPLFLMNLFMNP